MWGIFGICWMGSAKPASSTSKKWSSKGEISLLKAWHGTRHDEGWLAFAVLSFHSWHLKWWRWRPWVKSFRCFWRWYKLKCGLICHGLKMRWMLYFCQLRRVELNWFELSWFELNWLEFFIKDVPRFRKGTEWIRTKITDNHTQTTRKKSLILHTQRNAIQ